LGDLLDNIRNAYLAGAIVGIILILVGVLSLIHFSSSADLKDVYYGVGSTAFGSILLCKGAQPFIPIKQQNLTSPDAKTCPYCGALTQQDAIRCGKCKRKFDAPSS
jgi:hypothetical protein